MDISLVLTGMLENWWQVGLTIIACSLSSVIAYKIGLTKPFPFAIILGGIQTFMLVEVMPFLYFPGDWMTPLMVISTWVGLVLMDYFLPELPFVTG